MNKKSLSALFTVSMLTLTVSVGNLISNKSVDAKPAPETKEVSDPVQLLFVQNSVKGSYDGKRLNLNGVGSTIFFSDRPERISGHVQNSEFISHWDEGSDNFASNPPNATLSIFGEKGVNSVVIELTNPKLENNNISYQVKVLQGQLPANFQESSLFIDILGRWRMYGAGVAAGAAMAGAGSYYYHPPVYAPVAPVYPVYPVYAPPVYVAPRPILY
ncbi:MAG: hypothetical protein GW795_02385 [Cyanobacteria bacterium]|nr:hypothetical protein [Cyanobacteria bacterium CG_2015-16_32_12]NCO76732.1 hypothetical protein [Cyanobacteria bacterium CG_2015-22_32_23]NCQ03601.1 hypothetical protein [Cyanobacteria bacterium CG_2015-09_32_10]NCQ40748.1 hypothetical protein [Cyanobacteria bacterium CG_2015-04_32_10]NCS85259.1 hypothetical protein [Cyanobacteria bacterium CG_2015-02_32_10]